MGTEDARRLSRMMAGEMVMSARICEGIRKWRRIFEVSQVELAGHMGVSPSVVSDYESGRRPSPRVDTVQKIVQSLLEIDLVKGGRVVRSLRRLMIPEMPAGVILDMKEFSAPLKARRLVEEIGGEVVFGEHLLDRQIFGYTVIDSLRAIVELSRDDFIRFYGLTFERALVFTRVALGRSPFVAIKVGGMNPGIVVLHGEELQKVDELGKRIAESENIPLVIARAATVDDLVKSLRRLG